MAYSEALAVRVREALGPRDGVREQAMFGGVAWMLNGNMACGVMGDGLMVRLAREDAEAALAEPHVGPMEMTGTRMRSFVVVNADGIADDRELARWVDAGAAFASSLPAK
ncbi:MAG: TfoX/Sxy family protein [Solirubrobacteraceae bacterium]